MARYFTTRNASRPFKAGGLAFEFEPYEQTGGGSWLGVLAVEDNAAASILAERFPEIVIEIDEDAYEAIKKKSRKPGNTFVEIRVQDQPQRQSQPATPVVKTDTRSSAGDLLFSWPTTSAKQPDEPILVGKR